MENRRHRYKDKLGRKTIISEDPGDTFDFAVDPDTGRIVLVFATDRGVFVSCRSQKGEWTKAKVLDPNLDKNHDVAITALGKGEFGVRVKYEESTDFQLRLDP